jgi:transposase, IS5 family
MIRDRYAPQDLFTQIPKLCLQFEPVLSHLDRLLEDDELFAVVKADLARRSPRSLTRGRSSTPVEVILRLLVVRRLYGWSYEETEHFVGDSLILRQFCRLYWEPVPDDTTMIRWTHQMGPQTVQRLNERVVQLARAQKVTRGRKLRLDSTAVETTIHHPTDGALLADGIRVLGRLVKRAKPVLEEASGLNERQFAAHTRSARKWVRVIHGLARRVREAAKPAGKARKGATPPRPGSTSAVPPGETAGEKKRRTAQEAMREAYGRLIEIAQQSVTQAQRVAAALQERAGAAREKLRQQIATFVPRVEQVIGQARRRVIEGVAVAAKDKLVSLFAPHSQIIKRGKPGRDVEFGRKLWLDEVEGGIISRYEVLAEPGPDYAYLKDSLTAHQERFGKAPELLTADRGVASPENERLAKEAGVKRVVIPHAGKAPPERRAQERERWFRRGYRFRAGIEGRISVLKRRYGLGRCPEHGADGLGRWVGWGIMTANLVQIAQAQVARQTA